MKQAIKLARRALRSQEIPVGCVIVHEGRLIARAHNKTRAMATPLAHAEVLAVIQAQKKRQSPYLDDCVLYVTLEPCDLCRAVLRLCRLKTIYFGAYQTACVKQEPLPNMMGGFCEQEAQDLLYAFFRVRRQNKS